jgi:aryl-alcohol dehydrogenase-like predicted oxidoreductase
VGHLRENLAAAELVIPEEEMGELGSIGTSTQ